VRATNESTTHELGQLLSQRPYALQALGKAKYSTMPNMGGEAIQLHFVTLSSFPLDLRTICSVFDNFGVRSLFGVLVGPVSYTRQYSWISNHGSAPSCEAKGIWPGSTASRDQNQNYTVFSS